MPGLIDAHWHAFMAATPQPVLMSADSSYLHFRAAQEAEATLMRGFTTIRDLGGPVFGLKRAIDEGIVVGPRIYPSGAFISQTSGHGDFRFLFELPRQPGGPLSHSEREGIAAIADSPDEVRLQDARAVAQRRQPDQADGRRRRQLAAQPDRIDAVHRGRDPRRRRGGRRLGHLCHRARLHAAGGAAGDRCRGQMHRPRPAHRRRDRQADGRERCLVEPPAADLRCGRLRADEPPLAGEGPEGLRRDGNRLQAGEKIQHQDRLRRRTSSSIPPPRPAGTLSRHARPLDDARPRR